MQRLVVSCAVRPIYGSLGATHHRQVLRLQMRGAIPIPHYVSNCVPFMAWTGTTLVVVRYTRIYIYSGVC
jgi:hypothetical protein